MVLAPGPLSLWPELVTRPLSLAGSNWPTLPWVLSSVLPGAGSWAAVPASEGTRTALPRPSPQPSGLRSAGSAQRLTWERVVEPGEV